MNNSNIIALTGPTASGKSHLAVLLSKKINAEIINVDSSQIYKKLNIGTAKLSTTETKGIRHHLLDIIEPWQSYSVHRFLMDVKSCISQINSRNKRVLLVGGTMLYFKALIEGLSPLPSGSQIIRNKLKNIPLETLYKFLLKYDQDTAIKLSKNDRYRIQRAVEIIIITQQPYSNIIKSNKKIGGLGTKVKLCALVPKQRQYLYNNIKNRFNTILKKGFLKEVEILKKNNKITKKLPAMHSIGYLQAWKYLDGEYNYNSFVEKSIIATRQLAKRQLTWIRNWTTPIKLFEFDHNYHVDINALLL